MTASIKERGETNVEVVHVPYDDEDAEDGEEKGTEEDGEEE